MWATACTTCLLWESQNNFITELLATPPPPLVLQELSWISYSVVLNSMAHFWAMRLKQIWEIIKPHVQYQIWVIICASIKIQYQLRCGFWCILGQLELMYIYLHAKHVRKFFWLGAIPLSAQPNPENKFELWTLWITSENLLWSPNCLYQKSITCKFSLLSKSHAFKGLKFSRLVWSLVPLNDWTPAGKSEVGSCLWMHRPIL